MVPPRPCLNAGEGAARRFASGRQFHRRIEAEATLHPRENITGWGALGALSAEIVINADGASTVTLDLRGTFNMTVGVAGSVDGTNWILLAVRSISGGTYLAAFAGTAAGALVAACAGFAKIRARATAYTSGG